MGVRGDNNFLGYWNNPEATREAFTEDGFFKTGDIVEMLPDGYLKLSIGLRDYGSGYREKRAGNEN